MALKFLKVAFVAVAVLALFDGTEQQKRACRGKTVPDRYTDIEGCTEPQEALVQLQVPEGFAYVEPSFVRLKQCTGLSCGHRRHCLPQEGNIIVHKFKVYAFVGDKGAVCSHIEAEEHHQCQCLCKDPGCPQNMVVEEETCQCVCDPEKREACYERARKGSVMWSQDTCSCVCNKHSHSHCGTGETFDEELCECVGDYGVEESREEEDSEENYLI